MSIDYKLYLKKLLVVVVQKQASDFHITVDKPPILRINRQLVPLANDFLLQQMIQKNLHLH
jgi:Tfp pilus assembly ATPase PilU